MVFLNDILKTLNKTAINDIIEFQDIKRDEILMDNCKKILNIHLTSIIKHFGKTKINYRMKNKNKSDNYILSVIKCLASQCGYSFKSRHVIRKKYIPVNKYEQVWTIYYSICE